MDNITIEQLLNSMDFTILHPDATAKEVENHCKIAVDYDFKRVFVSPYYVSLSAKLLKNTNISVGTTVGFPFGHELTSVKSFECEKNIENGASEIDMVMNVAALKNKDFALVENDIKSVVEMAKKNKVKVKVILETCYLTAEEKVIASKISLDAGASFIKTSTGYASDGAKVEDIKLMLDAVKEKIAVKASGGIRTAKDAIAMIGAGAERIGTSAAPQIVDEFNQV